jgi:hypothetical protein
MGESLNSYLDGLIDYAGLYPPAKLDMQNAVDEYLNHIAGDEDFLVNRFVCPASMLEELLEAWPEPDDLTLISVTASQGESFTQTVANDLKLIREFSKKVDPEFFAVSGYEIRYPQSGDSGELKALSEFEATDIYVEVAADANLEDNLHALAASKFPLYAKFRCGGVVPNSHPNSKDLARFLKEVIDLDLIFKLTAGLHHPFPVQDSLTGDRMHGFLNVGVAISRILCDDLSRNEVARILDSPRVDVEPFTEEDWQEVREIFDGFGSCSIVEPYADLKNFDLI